MKGNHTVSPRIVSIFSGCGGLDLGFHLEGYNTVWANDFSEWACDSFRNYFGDVILHEDITKINPITDKSIPACDIILGGFPCQDFSIIWKQPGLNGKRGGLYLHFLDFVRAKKPKVFVAENVKGLLTANKNKAINKKGEVSPSLRSLRLLRYPLCGGSPRNTPLFLQKANHF